MRLGIYGGTFDPIHIGHLLLAREALEYLALDRILFVPNAVSPHKLGRDLTPGPIRMRMIEAAIAGEPGFGVDGCELRRPGPSYAVETAEEIGARFPGAELYYLIGEDNLGDLGTWHRFPDLDRLVRFAVLSRGGTGAGSGYPVIARRIDISATEIRRRVASGRTIRYWVPEAVWSIIEANNLYRESEPSNPKT